MNDNFNIIYINIKNKFKENKDEVIYLMKFCFPILIANTLNFVVPMLVNMVSVGHIGENQLAGVALGNTYAFSTMSFVLGSFNAMDTFISQGYGAKNYRLIGSTIQRALVISSALSILVTFLWIFCEPIFILLQQDPIVSKYSKQYILGMLPGFYCQNILTVLQKYLQGQGIMYPSIISGVTLNLSNVIFNLILVHGLTSSGGIGVVGCGLSTSISKLVAMVLLVIWINKFGLHKSTWFGFTKNELFGWEGIKEYLTLAIPAGAQMVFEGCAFEILTILAGLFGAIAVDGHSISMNFVLFTFMFPLSVSIALSVRIGQLLGQRKPQEAKKSMRAGFFITMSFMIMISIIMFFTRNVIGKMYTDKIEVLELVSQLVPIAALFEFVDGFQTTCQGIIRGTGKNKIGAIINFCSFYLVGMPLSCILAFPLKWNVKGLLWGLCFGLTSASIVLGFVVFRIDWEYEVKMALIRTGMINKIDNIDIELQEDQNDKQINGASNGATIIYDGDDEFERFNKEKIDEELGQAILNSTSTLLHENSSSSLLSSTTLLTPSSISSDEEYDDDFDTESNNPKTSILSKDHIKINQDKELKNDSNNI